MDWQFLVAQDLSVFSQKGIFSTQVRWCDITHNLKPIKCLWNCARNYPHFKVPRLFSHTFRAFIAAAELILEPKIAP